ncbi:MAG: DUF4190 domain-containing protein [Ruminococcus sp.]|nr:DUF4190 domain-containing protein [Ruminococcus sp.]
MSDQNQNYQMNNIPQGGYPQYQQQPPQKGTSGLAIASMVLGIVALVLSCFGWTGLICGALAVIMGGIAIAGKKGGKGMAIAGLVCGIIALIPSIFVIATAASILSELGL